jgi:predicted MFS family arabinose efflux permease
MMSMAPVHREPAGLRAWSLLLLLSLLYVLSFVDRFMLALMIAPLKRDLGMSDVQAGLLFGTWFALFYGVFGLPLARLADRGHRRAVIVGGAAVWSAATFASAFAQNYSMLAVLRMGLAIGEAALVPAALAALSQTFPHHRRVFACTLFSAAGMLGASLYSVIGAGVLEVADSLSHQYSMAPWRISLAIVGMPGLLLGALVFLIMREPRNEQSSDAQGDPSAVWRYFSANRRLYIGLFTAAAAVQALGYALVAWSPTLLQRVHGVEIGEAGLLLGVTNFVAIVGGTVVMPGLMARAIRGNPLRGAWLPVLTTGCGVALIVGGVLSGALWLCLVLLAVGMFLTTGTINGVQVLMQVFVPPPFRATLTAILMFSISCVGLGVGPTFAAWASSASGGGIAVGLAILAAPVIVIGVAAFAWAARSLAVEVERNGFEVKSNASLTA